MVQVAAHSARINDHYLCAGGELSSPDPRIHPGERQKRNRSPADKSHSHDAFRPLR